MQRSPFVLSMLFKMAHAVHAACLISKLLYASTEKVEEHRFPDPNMYEPFRIMNDAITDRVERWMQQSDEVAPGQHSTKSVPRSRVLMEDVRPQVRHRS